jgi:predicted O-methyltransferase YrrM
MKELFTEIERVLPDGGAWCSVDKACTLASLVVGLRPRIVVEIGVWQGGSAIPIALALRHVSAGRLIAIDPWSPTASIVDQGQADIEWWGSADHEAAYRKFLARIEVHGLHPFVTICRQPSDRCEPPGECQVCHVDGNHGEQAIRDVERFGSRVTVGGILVLDDVNWSTGSVQRAHARAKDLGFRDLYPLGTGVVMQRKQIPGGGP